ncbi:34725_t:CDS:1, partial [Gigaspora margarita]
KLAKEAVLLDEVWIWAKCPNTRWKSNLFWKGTQIKNPSRKFLWQLKRRYSEGKWFALVKNDIKEIEPDDSNLLWTRC